MKDIRQYKNPLSNQYVCPEGYSFYRNGVSVGRVIWTSCPEEYYIKEF